MLPRAMDVQDLRPPYLTGPSIYVRSMVEEDKEHGAAWLGDPFPVNASQAEKVLTDEHKGATWRRQRRYAIARVDGDEVVGGALVESSDGQRTCWVNLHMAPWVAEADALRGEALGILVRWLRDESELMVVSIDLADDQTETIASAEAAGMIRTAQLREWYARPGGRADRLVYQALNPRWEVRDA